MVGYRLSSSTLGACLHRLAGLLGCALLASSTGCSDDAGDAVHVAAGAAGIQQGTAGASTGAAGSKGGGGTVVMAGGSAGTADLGGMGDAAVDLADAAGSPDASGSVDAGDGDGALAHYGHRALVSTSHQGPIAIVSDDAKIEWRYDYMALGEEANDAWMMPNGDIVFGYKNGAQRLTQNKTVVWNYPAPSGSEIHSCVPLPNGHYLIGEVHGAGIAYLRELDETAHVTSSVTVDSGNAGLGTHSQFRQVRKTPQGTYLVTYIDLGKGREIDGNGKMLREFPCGSFVATRLPNANTLVACGDSHRVIEVDAQNKVVWEANETSVPGHRLSGFACGLTRLPGGNTVICSWPGHLAVDPHTSQCFEITPDHEVVWDLKIPELGWVSSIELLDPAAKVGGVVLR
jgi:hypothetical protein